MGILATCTPRSDVLSGDLKDAIFAADFGDVVSNHSGTPDVYRNPQLFFRNTHPARDLARIVREVFSVLAKDGDTLQAGMGILVVEAMKMQNELRSPKDGRLKQMLVREGMNVNAGDVLAVLE